MEIPNLDAILSSAPLLDTDLSTVDTSLPLFADNSIIDFIIDKVEQKPTKDGKGVMLSIDHKSITAGNTFDGKPLNPGAHVFNNIMLVPTGKADWDMVTRNIAALTQGVGMSVSLADFIRGRWMELQGKTVRAKVSYVPAGLDRTNVMRRAKNEIALYIKQ